MVLLEVQIIKIEKRLYSWEEVILQRLGIAVTVDIAVKELRTVNTRNSNVRCKFVKFQFRDDSQVPIT